MLIVFFLLFLLPLILCESPCRQEPDATICKDIELTPLEVLESTKKILVLERAKGNLTRENLSQIKSVNELKIRWSALDGIESDALCSTPRKLKTIAFVNNTKLPLINGNIFKNCDDLKHLYFFNTRTKIENGAFEHLEDLESLTLENVILPNIVRRHFFQGLKSLKSLTIKNAKFQRFDSDAFDELKDLEYLSLSDNGIETIPDGLFRKLSQLKILDLSHNRLSGWNGFDGLKRLRVLFLDHNEFVDVDTSVILRYLPKLERILFSFDKIPEEDREKSEGILAVNKITVINT